MVTRIANTVPGVAIAAVGSLYFLGGASAIILAAGVVASLVVGAILAYRGFQLSVECSQDFVVVHGFLRSRKIGRRAVVAVTTFPGLRWRDNRGRPRWTPITAFADAGGVLSVVTRHNDASVGRLRRHLRR